MLDFSKQIPEYFKLSESAKQKNEELNAVTRDLANFFPSRNHSTVLSSSDATELSKLTDKEAELKTDHRELLSKMDIVKKGIAIEMRKFGLTKVQHKISPEFPNAQQIAYFNGRGELEMVEEGITRR